MIKTGNIDLPLHSGQCPRWLFSRMVKLGKEISKTVIFEYSVEEFLKRLSNPLFFQSLGCVLGFDWHSSGLTTTTCGALKEGLNGEELGVKLVGGKGAASKHILEEIRRWGGPHIEDLEYVSKTAAKVDNTLVQDNFHLYHHTLIFSDEGDWAVIQQGLNPSNMYARRYHWLSTRNERLKSYVEQPHKAICCDLAMETLNLTSRNSREARSVTLDLVKDNPDHLKRFLSKQATLLNYRLPRNHLIPELDKRNLNTLSQLYEVQPDTYEEFINVRGVGLKIVRALTLVAQLIYGAGVSWKDPITYSFAHGGKDGVPYPVNEALMDNSIQFLKDALEEAKIGSGDKLRALKRLKHHKDAGGDS